MATYRTQMTINVASNVGADAATNTWHCTATNLQDLDNFNAALVAFYQAVDVQFSDLVRASQGLTWKSYNLSDPEPRAPVDVGSATLTPGGGAPLPPEVALCLSFQAQRASGFNQGGRRNRIYLPFFGEAGNGTDGRPTNALLAVVQGAAATLLAASGSAANWSWVVNSPSQGDALEIADGWVDNEWDTQRRRGRIATSRVIFPT